MTVSGNLIVPPGATHTVRIEQIAKKSSNGNLGKAAGFSAEEVYTIFTCTAYDVDLNLANF